MLIPATGDGSFALTSGPANALDWFADPPDRRTPPQPESCWLA